jgi:hypothetical protein
MKRVTVLITLASLCSRRLVAHSGLPAEDIEIALPVLFRTRSIKPAETGDACRSALPASR